MTDAGKDRQRKRQTEEKTDRGKDRQRKRHTEEKTDEGKEDGGKDRQRKRQTVEKTDTPAEDMKHPQKDKGLWVGGVGGGVGVEAGQGLACR